MKFAMLEATAWGDFAAQMSSVLADADIRGAIVKIGAFDTPSEPADLTAVNAVLRRIETGSTPFVAVIERPVTAAGFEVSLACHHRIASDDPNVRIAICDPRSEAMPELGGTQRLPRLVGVGRALALLFDGRSLSAAEAQAARLVDAVVPSDNILEHARAWILAQNGRAPSQPWDAGGHRTSASSDQNRDRQGASELSTRATAHYGPAIAKLREGNLALYPAPVNILSSVYEGCQVDLDNGLRIESRYGAYVRGTAESRNLARLRRYRQELDALANRPPSPPPMEFSKIGILGAGMMGAGIAYACADADLDVALLDVTEDIAERGKSKCIALFDRLVAKEQMTADHRQRGADRIHATADFASLRGCDVVIEAVFEDRAIKAEVTRQTEAVTGNEIVFASNTSTLPITGLAEAWSRAENFIGMHFFSPVDRMPLVEIIRGRQTSDACLARALDLVRRLRKTPIVVRDSRGFYTSRVFSAYVNEGMCMLLEGVSPALIENAARIAGMPVGPLAVADEVSLELMRHVRQQAKADLGERYLPTATDETLAIMIDQHGRSGKKARRGFYDYPEGGRKRLWPGLAQCFSPRVDQPGAEELIRRFRWIQSLETVRCMEEGVLLDRRGADVGSVLGWGFCPTLGGTIGHIQTVGRDAFIAQAQILEERYGTRFSTPVLLRQMAFVP